MYKRIKTSVQIAVTLASFLGCNDANLRAEAVLAARYRSRLLNEGIHSCPLASDELISNQ